MKVHQQGWLREMSFAKLLAMVVVFVAAGSGFLVLTDPSNAGRRTIETAAATPAHAVDARAQGTSDPSLPAAADVLAQPMPPEASAPTF